MDNVEKIIKAYNKVVPERKVYAIKDGGENLYKGRKAWNIGAAIPGNDLHLFCAYIMFKDDYSVEPFSPLNLSDKDRPFWDALRKNKNYLYYDKEFAEEVENSFDNYIEKMAHEK